MVDTRERKTVCFPLEICTFLETEEGWLEGLGTHNIDFPKENEGLWGGPDRGGWMVDTGERKAIGFPLEKRTFLGIEEGLLEGLGTQILIFPRENECFLGGSRS